MRGATYLWGMADYDNAIANFEKLIELDPENVNNYELLAMSYAQNGDYETAIVWYEEFIVRLNALGRNDETGEFEDIIAELKAQLGK